MKKDIVVGIIGCGRIGRLHTENILKNFKDVNVKAVSDLRTEETRAWAGSLGIPDIYSDYQRILDDPGIDAVFICSPTDTHSKITIEAAKAGKHIFCEKPIDFDIGKINDAVNAVEAAGVKFQVGFNRRFDHNFKAVKDMIDEGRIGEPHIIKITSRDPVPPPLDYIRSSGGIFLDMTIHDFDMARYLSGSEVVEVYTNAAVLVDPAIGNEGDVDTALISLKFANGALGVIDNSRKAAYGYDQRVEVFGSKGNVKVLNDTPHSAILSTEEGVLSEKPKYFFLERYMDSFSAETKEFFRAIRENRETSVSAVDGLRAVEIGIAARESYDKHRPVRV